MRWRSVAVVAAAGAAWFAVACLDISSPVTGISSITTVLLPTPSVVVKDCLRDTLGDVKPLAVYAFAPNGDTVKDVVVRYFAIDSTKKLRVDSITGLACGDSLSPLAKVVARVTPANGKGTLQTLQVPLPVVPTPDSASKPDSLIAFPFDPTAIDTLSSGVLSPTLDVKVLGGSADTTVQSYIVSYKIVRMPSSKIAGEPTVKIFDKTGNDSTIAVTSSSGIASRQLRLRLKAIPDVLRIPPATDTVVIQVRVLFQGKPLPVAPSDSFKLVLKPTF
ncbi:MAG TPA: hypothetical protein VJW73_23205 [Gemmatimonadaceae bacterium]|nr:hypothetical protein [Gemmatimonadaceae bacterium]